MNTARPYLPPKPIPAFNLCVQSSETAVREAIKGILDKLGPLDLDMEEAGTVELVLAEVLNNIVEHAYAPEFGPGPIMITCLHGPDGLHVEIEDEGTKMPRDQPPLGLSKSLDVETENLPEGGFGWFMIRELAKDVQYQRIDCRNRLVLRLAVGLSLPG